MLMIYRSLIVSLFAGVFFLAVAYSSHAVPATTSDHSRHAILQQNFQHPQEVTKACLSCHNDAATQLHATIHWLWLDPDHMESKKGKGGLTFNNFCISIASNEPRCTSCHIGYGWKDTKFDFTSDVNIDCIVCHDRTGTYTKFPTAAGYPATVPTEFEGTTFLPPDYKRIIASLGKPKRENCGSCHFYGGGGDSVKHGDLDSSLLAPDRNLDVHLSPDGGNFSCQRCHTTQSHKIAGASYSTAAFEKRTSLIEDDQAKRIACESCHTATPHKDGHKANDHTDKVACQSCHIPQFARQRATKVYWDWSQAGQLKDGKAFKEKDQYGQVIYDSKKGTFVWGQNITPVYRWYNGKRDFLLLSDEVDPSHAIEINRPLGDPNDPNSRIMPFKAHKGKQPFDPELNRFVAPNLFGNNTTAYWKNYDWEKAIGHGQEALGLPWSGTYTFVESIYYYPITHMVAPKENSVSCADCHSRNGRLAEIDDVWMPGRDRSEAIDAIGMLLVGVTIAGVGTHGFLRIFRSSRNHPRKK